MLDGLAFPQHRVQTSNVTKITVTMENMPLSPTMMPVCNQGKAGGLNGGGPGGAGMMKGARGGPPGGGGGGGAVGDGGGGMCGVVTWYVKLHEYERVNGAPVRPEPCRTESSQPPPGGKVYVCAELVHSSWP